MKSSPAFAALALFLAPFAASAQEEVSMKIDVVAWGNDISGLSLGSGKKKETLTARAFKYSDPVSYSGPRILELHKSGDGDVKDDFGPISEDDKEHESIPLPAGAAADAANQEGPIPKNLAKLREEDPTIVSLIRLPENARSATILLVPAAQGTYIGYVINDDPKKLPPGKLRVHNLSPHRIAMQFNGGAKMEMDARQSHLVNAPQGQVIYQLAYLLDGKWKVQENNIVPVSPDEQTHLIVLKSRNRFFLSADGATGGYLQMVMLRRKAE
jgi:hypothetical protein